MTAYEDFDLEITPVGKRYLASAVAPQAELTGKTQVKLPLIETGWSEVFAVLDAGVRQVAGQPRAAGDGKVGAERVGSTLFDKVFRGEVLSVFERSLGHAQGQGSGLRLRLHLSRAPELACLPWELLCYKGRFLAKASETPIVRCPDLAGAARPRELSSPVRLLLVMPKLAGPQELQGHQELSRIESSLAPLALQHRVDIETLSEGASRAELRKRLHDKQKPVHVLHFIGHGTFETLFFEGPERRADSVAASHLEALLSERSSLCLAVINACEGGTGDPGKRDSGLAQVLVRHIPAVVAMQARVSDCAAISFAGHFYEALADGLKLEEAMSKARQGVLSDGHDAEWAVPVLYSRSGENPFRPHLAGAAANRLVAPARLHVEAGLLRHAAEKATAARTKFASLAHLAASPHPLAWVLQRKGRVAVGLALAAAMALALYTLRPGDPGGLGDKSVIGPAGQETERSRQGVAAPQGAPAPAGARQDAPDGPRATPGGSPAVVTGGAEGQRVPDLRLRDQAGRGAPGGSPAGASTPDVASAAAAGREAGRTCGSSRAFPAMRFVRIPPDSDPEGESPEPLPGGISPFCLGAFEVTRGDVAEIDGVEPGERPRLPAEGISRTQAEGLAKRATQRDPDYSYRLPNREEWLYAARAGSQGSYGTIHYAGATGRSETCFNRTGPVEVERSGWNEWGVYGADGNVSEWVADSVPVQGTPLDPTQHPQGVFLGGNWSLKGSCGLGVYHNTAQPGYARTYLGFRLVREPKRRPSANSLARP